MEKLFWQCFSNTGNIDMYMLYKDYNQEQDAEELIEKEETQSSPTEQEGGELLF